MNTKKAKATTQVIITTKSILIIKLWKDKFNIISMISEKMFTFNLDFGLFLIIGIMFIICGIASRRLEHDYSNK